MIRKVKKRNLISNIGGIVFGLILLSVIVIYIFLNRQQMVVLETEAFFEHPKIPIVDENKKLLLGAQSFIVIDVDSNVILAKKNIDSRIYPASTTKLVTGMTALNVYPLDEIVKTVSYPEGQNMGLVDDDELIVRDLVESILIFSANDAAYNLARHHSGGIEGFVAEMNDLVGKYGLRNTHFVNFDGIHDQKHFSSAYDLSQIARLALKNKVITESAKVKAKEITSLHGNKYHLKTTNELLGVVAEIEGLKTGWTPEAGGCFIGLIKIGDKRVVSVVLNSSDRFAETKEIVDWLKDAVTWRDYSVSDI